MLRCDSKDCPNPATVAVRPLSGDAPTHSCAGCLTAGWRAYEALRDAFESERPGAVLEVIEKPRGFWSSAAGYELAERLRREAEEARASNS